MGAPSDLDFYRIKKKELQLLTGGGTDTGYFTILYIYVLRSTHRYSRMINKVDLRMLDCMCIET